MDSRVRGSDGFGDFLRIHQICASHPQCQFPGISFFCLNYQKQQSGDNLLNCYGFSPEKHYPFFLRHGICTIMVRKAVLSNNWYGRHKWIWLVWSARNPESKALTTIKTSHQRVSFRKSGIIYCKAIPNSIVLRSEV